MYIKYLLATSPKMVHEPQVENHMFAADTKRIFTFHNVEFRKKI